MCSKIACPAGRIRCRNSKCVPTYAVCDNIDDCGDGTDEEERWCHSLGKCKPGQFSCKSSNHCIDSKLRCDGENDCGDNSDEVGCDKSVCHWGVCSHQCLEKHGNHTCKCAHGFQVAPNGECVASGQQAKLVITPEAELRVMSPYKPGKFCKYFCYINDLIRSYG